MRDQDCTFILKVIDRVAPMNAAFQAMMEQCSTPYFVQVDEDMLLFPHAIRTLYEHIAREDSQVAQIVYALYDAHLEEVIYGLKIYRHSIVREFPFNDVDGCEWDQVRRLRNNGIDPTLDQWMTVRVDPRESGKGEPAMKMPHIEHLVLGQ